MRPNHAHPRLELKHLVQNRGVNFDLTLSEAEISEIVEQLDLLSLRKIKFSGVQFCPSERAIGGCRANWARRWSRPAA